MKRIEKDFFGECKESSGNIRQFESLLFQEVPVYREIRGYVLSFMNIIERILGAKAGSYKAAQGVNVISLRKS